MKVKSTKMLWFTHRKQLEKAYMKWVEKEKAANCPFNVITFLEIKNLLDRDKVIEYLRGDDND